MNFENKRILPIIEEGRQPNFELSTNGLLGCTGYLADLDCLSQKVD